MTEGRQTEAGERAGDARRQRWSASRATGSGHARSSCRSARGPPPSAPTGRYRATSPRPAPRTSGASGRRRSTAHSRRRRTMRLRLAPPVRVTRGAASAGSIGEILGAAGGLAVAVVVLLAVSSSFSGPQPARRRLEGGRRGGVRQWRVPADAARSREARYQRASESRVASRLPRGPAYATSRVGATDSSVGAEEQSPASRATPFGQAGFHRHVTRRRQLRRAHPCRHDANFSTGPASLAEPTRRVPCDRQRDRRIGRARPHPISERLRSTDDRSPRLRSTKRHPLLACCSCSPSVSVAATRSPRARRRRSRSARTREPASFTSRPTGDASAARPALRGIRRAQGPQGVQGPAGQPGAAAVSVWAQVTNAGSRLFGQGSVGAASFGRHVPGDDHGSGVRSWGERAGDHASRMRIPRLARWPARFPVAWYESTGSNQQFMVFTGVVVGGSFTPTDHTFTVMDTCM